MFINSNSGDNGSSASPNSADTFSYVSGNRDDFLHLRKRWVEVLSPYHFVNFGVYHGLTQSGTDVFFPSVVQQPYALGGENRMAQVWENGVPIVIPHAPGMVLIPRTENYVREIVASNGRLQLLSAHDVSAFLKDDRRMKFGLERDNPRAKKKLREVVH